MVWNQNVKVEDHLLTMLDGDHESETRKTNNFATESKILLQHRKKILRPILKKDNDLQYQTKEFMKIIDYFLKKIKLEEVEIKLLQNSKCINVYLT